MTPESLKQWADDHFREYGTPLPEAFTKMPYTNSPQFKAEQYASTQYDVNQYTEPDSVKGTGWTDCRDAWMEGFNADRWIPVTERMPEDGEPVIIAYRYGIGEYRYYDKMFIKLGIDTPAPEVTHWQPLPKTPTL